MLYSVWLLAIFPLSNYLRGELVSRLSVKPTPPIIDTITKLEDALDRVNHICVIPRPPPCLLRELQAEGIVESKDSLHTVLLTMLVRKNFPLLRAYRDFLRRIVESSLLSWKKYTPSRKCGPQFAGTSSEHAPSDQLAELSNFLLFFASLLGVCAGVFLMELYIGRSSKLPKRSLKNPEMTKAPIKDSVVSSPYPPIELRQDESFYQYVRRSFLERADQPALVQSGEKLRFADVLSLMERYASGFQRHGVSFGSRVCVNVSNSAESFVAVYSLCCLGAAVIMIKPTLLEREMLYQIEDSDAEHILTEQQNAEKVMNIHKKRRFKTLFSIDRTCGFVCVQDFEDGGKFQEPQIEDTRSHTMVYIYTSGTTALPKGVEISMFAYKASIELTRAGKFFHAGDVFLGWNPVTHTSGFVFTMAAFISGAMVLPSPGGLSPKDFVDTVNKHQKSGLSAERRSGPIIERNNHLWHMLHRRLVPKNTPGDAGYYDSSGNLYVVERIKDVIKCLDQQVAPAEIETLLSQHPLVLEAAVVGIDHPELGEAPTAFVVLDPSGKGRVSEQDLVRLVAEQISFHKNLHGGVIFVDRLPTTDTGKYQRRKLRQEFLHHLQKCIK
ncbi:hypothetical protein HPB50_012804 [Hyalomma asiaticum]|uniref:Uncharacterized protein n=1 Tax=Hyalomma asiaticum TaxID=266040 RepID=A0ACB7RPL5_HYAAI|nr:hypothetical protein HPB50_012804 [Hyalomma asiaticum]